MKEENADLRAQFLQHGKSLITQGPVSQCSVTLYFFEHQLKCVDDMQKIVFLSNLGFTLLLALSKLIGFFPKMFPRIDQPSLVVCKLGYDNQLWVLV